MRDVAIWLWGLAQGSATTAFGVAAKLGVPTSGPGTPWWMIGIMLITIFGNGAALAFLIDKFRKHW